MAIKIKRYRGIVGSIVQPEDKEVLWLDISNSDKPILKAYIDGEWLKLASGGGIEPTPTPQFENPFYYGGSNTEITIDTINTVIQYFSNTKNYQAYANIVEPYYYIALPDGVILSKITTENNEQIKNDFILKGDFTLNSINYKLYEFHLSSGLSLDASVTINVTK